MAGMLTSPQPAPNPQMQRGRAPFLPEYDGEVSIGDKTVTVKAGLVALDGETYMVMNKGELVTDHKGAPVGYVENATFKPMTEEYLNKLGAKYSIGK